LPPDYTLTGGAVRAALVAAGLAEHPGEVRLVHAPWYRGMRGWAAWVDLPRRWIPCDDTDPAGVDYFDRRDRVAAVLGVDPRRVMLHTYPGGNPDLIVSVHNASVVDLMAEQADADD